MEGTLSPAVSEPESPKQAFRAAEAALSAVALRNPLPGITAALARIAAALAELGIEATAAAYRRDLVEYRRAAGTGEFPERLIDADLGSVANEAAAYEPPASPARAVWRAGVHREWVIVWRFAPAIPRDALVLVEAFRLVLGQRLVESSLSGILEQAAAIQRSLLPDPLPEFPGFDLAARSVPAESVGGDVFDMIALAPDAIAFSIADASGHGLPAALEARDIVVGLRMGAARHMKIDATVEKLNGILCRETLSSRFVSLVYGELEEDGRFQFVNAGHPHPIVVSADGTRTFPETGLVLGVSPRVRHRVQHGEIEPGGALVLVTDGILEARSPSGEEFGASRVGALVRALIGKPSAWIVSALFEALMDHSRETNPADDATAMVIKRDE